MPATGTIETTTEAAPAAPAPYEYEYVTRVRVRLGAVERWGWIRTHGEQDGDDMLVTVSVPGLEDRVVRFVGSARVSREMFLPATHCPTARTTA